MVGDWDNDGADNIGVVDENTSPSTWNLDTNGGGAADISLQYGLSSENDQYYVGNWADVLWDGNQDGDGNGITWAVADNWSGGVVPTSGQSVVIDQPTTAGTIHIGASTSTGSVVSTEKISFSSGTWTLAEDSSLLNGFDIGGSTFAPAGTVTVRGSSSWGRVTLSGTGVTINEGIIDYYGGTLTVNAGASLVNAGTFNHTANSTVRIDGTVTTSIYTLPAGRLEGSGTIVGALSANSGATVAPGNSPGTLNTDNFDLQSGATLEIEIGGVNAGNTASDHDQVNVTGTVTLAGIPDVSQFNSFTSSVGDQFTIISNDGADAVSGTFSGLPEGSTISDFLGTGLGAIVSYAGGDGNDVVLTAAETAVTVSGGTLYITDTTLAGVADNLTITTNGANFEISSSGGLLAAPGLTGDGTTTVTVPISSITGNSISVNSGGGNDSITLGSTFAPGGAFAINIDGGSGTDSVTWDATVATLSVDVQSDTIVVNGNISTSGSDSVSMTAERDIVLNSGSSITTVAGNITLTADDDDSGDGPLVIGGDLTSTGGSITVSGNNTSGIGVEVVGRTLSTTGTGAITIDGTGGSGAGFFMRGDITAVDGNIQVTGSSTSQQGFIVTDSGGTLLTTGTGDIIIDGTGGNRGSQIQNNFVLSTINGNIQITGDATDRGVFIDNAVVESTGTGSITLNGTGNNIGVSLKNSNGRVTSADGSISITGMGPGNDITTFSSATINSTNGGNISLFAEELAIGGPVKSAGALLIEPRTASTTIGLGGGAGTLNIDDTEITNFTNGFSSITIGDGSNTAVITIESATFVDDVNVIGDSVVANGLNSSGGGNTILATADTGDVTGTSIGATNVGVAAQTGIGTDAVALGIGNNITLQTESGDINVTGNIPNITSIGGIDGISILDASDNNSGLDNIDVLFTSTFPSTSQPIVNNDGGNIILTTIVDRLDVNSSITATGGNGAIEINAKRFIRVSGVGTTISTVGIGGVTMDAEFGDIQFNGAGLVQTESGDISMTALDGTTGGGLGGVFMSFADIVSQTGSVMVSGAAGSGSNRAGIKMENGSTIQTTGVGCNRRSAFQHASVCGV